MLHSEVWIQGPEVSPAKHGSPPTQFGWFQGHSLDKVFSCQYGSVQFDEVWSEYRTVRVLVLTVLDPLETVSDWVKIAG